VNRARFKEQEEFRKRNAEDTLAYLERLKKHNKLVEAPQILRADLKKGQAGRQQLPTDSIFDRI
jgi:hypothetical protein